MSRWLSPVVAVLVGLASWQAGDRAQARLSDPTGFQLTVDADALDPQRLGFARPRRVFLVVIDGLRADAAANMAAMDHIGRAGACWKTHTPVPTVSMAVYATLSTGVEAARHGVRSNGTHEPEAAESIWDAAHRQGWEVVGWSELAWWRELFPKGFGRYNQPKREQDFFALAAAGGGDLVLVHPVYVDEAGHDHGADSRAYVDAVARADRELTGLVAAIDPTQDLLIVTSDHGHVGRGGHGGDQPEVTTTMTCAAGPHLVPSMLAAAVPGPQEIPALLALATGLPLPASLTVKDPAALLAAIDAPPSYKDDRASVLARRAQAAARLPTIYAEGRTSQQTRGAIALGVILLVHLVVCWRRKLSLEDTGTATAWLLGVAALHVGVYWLIRGSFDGTSIRARGEWIRAAFGLGLAVACVGAAVNLVVFGSLRRTAGDQLQLVVLAALVDVAHAVTYGWPVGFPMPGAAMLFLPFFLASFVTSHAVVGFALGAFAAIEPRRA